MADRMRIETEVQEKVGNCEVFTAFDVTKALRSKYSDFTERHKAVRSVVHEIFENGDIVDYNRTRTNLNVKGNDIAVFVFHPANIDISQYTLTEPAATPKPVNVAKVAPAAASVVASTKEAIATLTDNNRLQIPKSVLDTLGTPTVTVKVNGTKMTYNRNKDGRVRVKVNNPVKTSYKVTVDNGEVVLS